MNSWARNPTAAAGIVAIMTLRRKRRDPASRLQVPSTFNSVSRYSQTIARIAPS
jgi:hypothetical protein